MKHIFLTMFMLGMCSSPDIELLEKKVTRLTEKQAQNTKAMNELDELVDKLVIKSYSTQQNPNEPAKIGVVANMYTFQIMLETYAVDWGGVYPDTVLELFNEAKIGDYYREFKNPYTNEIGINKSTKNGFARDGCNYGMVYYHVINYTNYEITGCEIERKPTLDKQNIPFILSNY